jgi:hypothetical protein
MMKVTTKKSTRQINQIPKYLALYSKISSTANLIPFQLIQILATFNKNRLLIVKADQYDCICSVCFHRTFKTKQQ